MPEIEEHITLEEHIGGLKYGDLVLSSSYGWCIVVGMHGDRFAYRLDTRGVRNVGQHDIMALPLDPRKQVKYNYSPFLIVGRDESVGNGHYNFNHEIAQEMIGRIPAGARGRYDGHSIIVAVVGDRVIRHGTPVVLNAGVLRLRPNAPTEMAYRPFVWMPT